MGEVTFTTLPLHSSKWVVGFNQRNCLCARSKYPYGILFYILLLTRSQVYRWDPRGSVLIDLISVDHTIFSGSTRGSPTLSNTGEGPLIIERSGLIGNRHRRRRAGRACPIKWGFILNSYLRGSTCHLCRFGGIRVGRQSNWPRNHLT